MNDKEYARLKKQWEIDDAVQYARDLIDDRDKAAYFQLQDDLYELGRRLKIYLADESVDEENVGIMRGEHGFWGAMYEAARTAAYYRGKEAGIDINTALGRVIF